MAQNTWQAPNANTDIYTAIVTMVNNALANVRTFHSGATDPAGGGGAGATPYMGWWDTSGSPTVLKIRNAADSAWITVGDLTDNLGHLRVDGTVAMTGNLDMGDQSIVDCYNETGASASPGTPDILFRMYDGANPYWVPGYTNKPS